MVDFNSDGALGTNRSHILDLVILGRRDEWLNTFQKFQISKVENGSDQIRLLNILRGIAQTMEFEIRETLKRRLNKEYDKFKEELYHSQEEKVLMNCFDQINTVLDKLQITRIDTRKQIDFTNIEESNTAKGL